MGKILITVNEKNEVGCASDFGLEMTVFLFEKIKARMLADKPADSQLRILQAVAVPRFNGMNPGG